jgi:Protein of unknown function (DUF3465)
MMTGRFPGLKPRHYISALVVLLAAVACSAASSDKPDNIAAVGDIRDRKTAQEVVVEGTVESVLPNSRTAAGDHQNFIINLSTGEGEQQLVLVSHNIDIAPSAPLKVGDDVVVKGELEIDPKGPVIHWTHHDPRLRHQPGFIRLGGATYE